MRLSEVLGKYKAWDVYVAHWGKRCFQKQEDNQGLKKIFFEMRWYRETDPKIGKLIK